MIKLDSYGVRTEYIQEVGIEFELEGTDFPYEVKGWEEHHEASLKGEGTEFVVENPINRYRIGHVLNKFMRDLEDSGTELEYSTRTSSHIHINVTDLTIPQIFNFITLFLVYEEMLMKFCGEDRINNLFCLSSQEAGYLISKLEKASSIKSFMSLNSEELRYAAINTKALFKFGSLEFRGMRGVSSEKDIPDVKKWIKILLAIKDASKLFDNPIDIIKGYSIMSPEVMTESIFGAHSNIIFKYEGWKRSVMSQMRRLQLMAYEGKWDSFDINRGD